MVYVPATENNVGLASAVNNRIDADGRLIRGQATMVTAKAWLWRLSGVGLLATGIGAGIGLGLFGYSYVNDSRTSLDKMASAIRTALEQSHLVVNLDPKATVGVAGSVDMKPGVVTLAPGSTVVAAGTVALEPGGTVSTTGTVSVAPGGSVRVIDGGTITRPTERQLTGSSTTVVTGKTVTNYTIFKSVSFGSGQVKTGWDFVTSEQDTPTRQFCYYTEEAGAGMQMIMSLAQDGKMLDAARAYKALDIKAAAAQCVWFNGQSTQ